MNSRWFLVFFVTFVVIVTSNHVLTDSSHEVGETDLQSLVVQSLVTSAMGGISPHVIRKRAVDLVQTWAPKARALIPVELSLAGLTLFGTFKAAVLFLASIFIGSSLLPAILNFLGIPAAAVPFRSLEDSVKNQYQIVARSLETLEKKQYLLDVSGEDCDQRMLCEIGDFVGGKYPSVSNWLQKLGGFDKLILGDQYSLSLLKGVKQQKCDKAYPKCQRSPFWKWNEIADNFR